MAEENIITWHWRNTMKPVRFFKFDARAGGAILLVLVHARWSTLVFAIVVNLLFMFLERKGLTVPSAMRAFRVWILGNDRPAFMRSVHRSFMDTGSR